MREIRNGDLLRFLGGTPVGWIQAGVNGKGYSAKLEPAGIAGLKPRAQVLTVLPDGPHRYLCTIYDDEWCSARGLFDPLTTQPVEIAALDDVEAQGWARCRVVQDPAQGRVST